MYAIGINSDDTVTVLANQRIQQNFKLSNWFWILVYPYYNDIDLSGAQASLQYVLPVSKISITEKLDAKAERYNNQLKYVIPANTQITREAGTVDATVTFVKSGSTIRSVSFSIKIATSEEYHDDPTLDINQESGTSSGSGGGSGGSGAGCDCDSDEHIAKIIEQTRPLVYDSMESAETAINSGEVKNIYLGQSIIIVKDGKYTLYTIQRGYGGNSYVVEPVDTVGDIEEELVWLP